MTPILNARLADMPYLVRKTLTESTPQLYGLLFRLKHPDQIEGWDPNEVDGETNLSDWEDERNSRPLPY